MRTRLWSHWSRSRSSCSPDGGRRRSWRKGPPARGHSPHCGRSASGHQGGGRRVQTGEADRELHSDEDAWGDPDISGYYLVATYTPLQRPERLKDKPLFTEDEAIDELARVIGQDAEVDPRNVHYDWKEYGMDGWQSPIRPSLRTSLIVDPAGRTNSSAVARGTEAAGGTRGRRAREGAGGQRQDAREHIHALHYGQCRRWAARARRQS